MNQANKIALVQQVVQRAFPDSKLVAHDGEWLVVIGDGPKGISMAITSEVLESKTVHDILMSVIACAETKGIKPRPATP